MISYGAWLPLRRRLIVNVRWRRFTWTGSPACTGTEGARRLDTRGAIFRSILAHTNCRIKWVDGFANLTATRRQLPRQDIQAVHSHRSLSEGSAGAGLPLH